MTAEALGSAAGSVVILAAGKGTRMRSELPKVLHRLSGLPMVAHVVRAALPLARERNMRLFVVVGHGADAVARAVPEAVPILQREQRGTGHALAVALEHLPSGPILLLHGDMPLVTTGILHALFEAHAKEKSVFTLATAVLEDPAGYGRILRDPTGAFQRVVEYADATPAERAIREINAALYVMERSAVELALKELKADNAQGELYLPDIARILLGRGERVVAVQISDATLVTGINNRFELGQAAKVLYARRARELALSGVGIEAPDGVRVDTPSEVGEDAYVGEGVSLRDSTVVGAGARIVGRAEVIASRMEAGAFLNGGRVRHVHMGPGARIVGASQIGQTGDEGP